MTDEYDVEPLGRDHDRTAFFCGVASLDHYLKEIASQDQRRHAAAIFVLVERTTRVIAGYYTLSAAAVELAVLPDAVKQRLPRYPAVPATLIGRLAVNRRHQGQGLGGLLLSSALDRSLRQCEEIGSALVVVDALDAAAVDFYKRFGFTPIPDEPNRHFMLMATVAKAKAAR